MSNRVIKMIMLLVGQLFLATMFLALIGDNHNFGIRHLLIPDAIDEYLIYFGQLNWKFFFACTVLFLLVFWFVLVPSWINNWIRKRK